MPANILHTSGIRDVVKRIFPFLRGHPSPDQEQVRRVLLVGSASLPNIKRVLESLHTRFPGTRLVLLVGQASRPFRGSVGIDEIIAYQGPQQARRLRQQVAGLQCDLKVVLFTGEGQVPLKLLAFLLPARRMLVYTEGGGSFTWDFDNRLAIWNHIKWRFGGGQPVLALLRRLGRAVINPLLSLVVFLVLLLWHGCLLVKRSLYRRRFL